MAAVAHGVDAAVQGDEAFAPTIRVSVAMGAILPPVHVPT